MRSARNVVLAGLLTALVTVIGQASAASPASTSMRCHVHAKLKNGQESTEGALVGFVTCSRPIGKGSYSGSYRDHLDPSSFVGSETGSSKLSFKAGTVRGTYRIRPALLSGTAPFHGTFHITGGTRRFKHV